MTKKFNSRNTALDIIRCFALFCVISVHYFRNTDFYTLQISGSRMFFMVTLRCAFLICVPLFMILSGYLMRNKKPSKQYCFKIIKIIAIYVMASICCGMYSSYAAQAFYNSTVSIHEIILGIFSYKTAPYSWYINMYIGLFFLIPFLNVLYNNLESKKNKQYLLLTLICFSSLPTITNIYNLTDIDWWALPSSSSVYHQILPNFWVNLYPITYYFIGSYLSEYPINLKPSTNLVFILIVCTINGAFNYYRSYQSTYVWGAWQEYASTFILLLAVLVFNFFLQFDYSKLPAFLKKLLSYCSNWSLGAYLVSWIYDQKYYSNLVDLVPDSMEQFNYFLPVVLTVYIHSLALSAVINLIYSICEKAVHFILSHSAISNKQLS